MPSRSSEVRVGGRKGGKEAALRSASRELIQSLPSDAVVVIEFRDGRVRKGHIAIAVDGCFDVSDGACLEDYAHLKTLTILSERSRT